MNLALKHKDPQVKPSVFAVMEAWAK